MKYKVGDRVRIKSLDWYNENKKKELRSCIECGNMMFTPQMSKWCGKIVTIIRIENNCYMDENARYWTDEMIEGLVEEEIIDLTSIVMETVEDKTIQNALTYGYNLPDGYQFVDENGNVINATKIVLEKKKKEYPKTYEECLLMTSYDKEERILYLLEKFKQLLICRNAYWKIAGEEMGLGKPWEPDFTNDNEERYGIYIVANKVVKDFCGVGDVNTILTFPTEEMVNAFYENFKELIEICKELL